jgi:hypothetical protein
MSDCQCGWDGGKCCGDGNLRDFEDIVKCKTDKGTYYLFPLNLMVINKYRYDSLCNYCLEYWMDQGQYLHCNDKNMITGIATKCKIKDIKLEQLQEWNLSYLNYNCEAEIVKEFSGELYFKRKNRLLRGIIDEKNCIDIIIFYNKEIYKKNVNTKKLKKFGLEDYTIGTNFDGKNIYYLNEKHISNIKFDC